MVIFSNQCPIPNWFSSTGFIIYYILDNTHITRIKRIHIWYPQGTESIIVKVTQPCPTLCDPMDYSPPGCSVRGIFQARILEWVVIFFSRGSSQSRDLPDIISLHSWMQFVNILFRIFETLFTVRSACNFSSLLIHFGRWILLPLSHLGGPDMYL